MKDYSILIGGAAGEGSKKAGLIIAEIFSSYGYEIFIQEDYQSVIKGGHNFSIIRASKNKVLNAESQVDFVLALNKETAEKHYRKLKKNGVLVYNSDIFNFSNGVKAPIDSIVKENSGLSMMKNTALIGWFAKMIGIDKATIKKVIEKQLLRETEMNLKIAFSAYEKAETLVKIEKNKKNRNKIITGNEAISIGALKAGLEAYVAYPMTPATSILNYMSALSVKNKIVSFQAENEIGAVNSAIGLAFAGKKTMTGTSGGGFALMNEAISLSAQSETPLIIVEGQRTGPATGVPTYGGQSDVLHVLASGHGDFQRIVLTPGDAEEACLLTGLAVNWAWRYQGPVIVLVDKDLCESSYSFNEKVLNEIQPEKINFWDNKEEYQRYKITRNGISPLAFPGTKNALVKGTSYEHNEKGISVEDEKSVKLMQDKRKRKYSLIEKELNQLKLVNVYGNKKSKTALIAWGSVKGVAVETAKELGIKVIQPMILDPFPEKEIKKHLKGVNQVVVAELNSSAQTSKLLNCYGINVSKKILKYTGRPFSLEEIKKQIKI